MTDRTVAGRPAAPTPDLLATSGGRGRRAAGGVGTVVPPAAVEAGAWSEITERARAFAAALTARRER